MKHLALLLVAVSAFAFQSGGGYHLLQKIELNAAPGGGEYFDYITFDAAERRVFLSHGTEVEVLSADSGKVVGTIRGLKRCHGVALVPELNRGFISDGNLAEAIIFDLNTLKTIGTVKAEPDADSILYEPVSKRVFVFAGDSNKATVIDPHNGSVIATIPLGGAPEQAVADGKGMIYDNLEDKNEVIALDARTLKIVNRWPVTPAGQPVSIAMDLEHRRLFIAGRNPKTLVEMNADTGKIIGEPFPIGGRVDTNIFDPERKMIAASTGDGTIEIFREDSPDKLMRAETVKTEYGAKTMALDPKTHYLYVDTADFEAAAPGATKGNQPRAKPGTFHLLIYGQ